MIAPARKPDLSMVVSPHERRRASEIPPQLQLQCVNGEHAPALKSLAGRVVVLGFWSTSGVHCSHQVADLSHLQSRFNEGVTVIGIHTPKFERERDARLVREAVSRMQIRFPVLNDPEFVLWQHYGVRCWPTAVVIDAEGRVAATIEGDGTSEIMVEVTERLLDEASAHGLRAFVPASDFRLSEPRSALSFPARLALGDRHLYVADSGHHRVLECGHDGRIQRVFGSGSPDFRDGEGHEASFCHPQGLALGPDALYVADTGNHAVRRIRLSGGRVDTIAGTGRRGQLGGAGHASAPRQPLNAPADLTLHQGGLFVAMRGNHQIWRLGLDGAALKLVAGSGRLGSGDGSALDASFAQPSGLAVCGPSLLVSDADSSALRVVSLSEPHQVRTVVGAGVFVFGNADGHRADARMQFPQGLCADQRHGLVYVADSFNDRIRVLHLGSGELRSLAIPLALNQPGGVALGDGGLWIANSGAHEVLRFDLARASASRIAIGD